MNFKIETKEKKLFSIESEKSIEEFIEDFRKKALEFNFNVRYVFDMREEYASRNVDVSKDFRLYQIVVCSFKRSYKSTQKNIERAAVLLQPKQIIVFVKQGKTIVNYLPFTEEFIEEALPGDEEFSQGLYRSCQKIIKLIKAIK